MRNYEWYQELKKPAWAPPARLFGPVWSILYILIAVSFGTVFYRCGKGSLPWSVAVPFLLNLVFNLAFTPIQFGLKNNFLAAADVLAVLGTLIWAVVLIASKSPWIAWVNIPYLLWTAFATALQLTITRLNLGG